tara:strand:- start:380 stop:973 length:594 start_codon:yes stop_codon:yes gene_type:complete
LIVNQATAIDLNDDAFVMELREQMLKFARLQLNDEQLAEDAVQEALVGALRNSKSFARKSALKTWVFAILKNKISDVLRGKYRRNEVSDDSECNKSENLSDELFDDGGHWHADERPLNWGAPQKMVYDEQFWRVMDACLNHLPANQARAFMMREFIELSTDEICESLEVSVSNLNVMLYRARLRLRECLENHWFAKT